MRKLGIIGGTSWSSTALYYDHINRAVAQRLGGFHSARLVLESVDFADLIALEDANDWDGVAKLNIDAAQRLQAAGAEGMLMACNTTHKVYDAVAANVDIPVLHIADPAGDRLAADRIGRVALLGTRFTMTEPYVRSRLESRGIDLVTIDPAWIAEVDRIIFEELARGRVVRDSQRKLKTLMTELAKHKVQAVVLGCTELALAVDTRANVIPVYDTAAIHARAAVEWMLEEAEQARAAA
ncbi:aspartate/glutamate racemase family protein [Sphingomonas daechungensis]|uniref:aspartate/glutamate racemase family protein n=1 Tax=Sphingomonas daechungensis TaxID=1176646 RepID=UPI0037836C05